MYSIAVSPTSGIRYHRLKINVWSFKTEKKENVLTHGSLNLWNALFNMAVELQLLNISRPTFLDMKATKGYEDEVEAKDHIGSY